MHTLVDPLRRALQIRPNAIAFIDGAREVTFQYFEAYVGIPAGGMVVVPLNTRHAMPELVYALKDSGANILISDRADVGELAAVVEHAS